MCTMAGAQIRNLVNQAAIRAALEGRQRGAYTHLAYARDKALMGTELGRFADEEANKVGK